MAFNVYFYMILMIEAATEVFCKKGALRNFAKFTGKYLYQSLFFEKAAGGASVWVTASVIMLFYV